MNMELYVTTSLKHCIFTYKKAQIIKKLKILYKLLRFDEKYTLSKSLGKKKKSHTFDSENTFFLFLQFH